MDERITEMLQVLARHQARAFARELDAYIDARYPLGAAGPGEEAVRADILALQAGMRALGGETD